MTGTLVATSKKTPAWSAATRASPPAPQPELCIHRWYGHRFRERLMNAFEALGGAGELRVRVAPEEDNVRVEISDTGPGIPPEKLASLFDIGFAARREGRIGMGLGLPTAKSIIDKHRGRLSVESQIGKGTTLVILLPIRRAAS